MPSLHIFDRRTSFASDDLPPASILTILLRSVEFILLLPLLLHIRHSLEKDANWLYPKDDEVSSDVTSCTLRNIFPVLLTCWSLTFLLFLVMSTLVEMIIFQKSMKGSPIQPELRAGVGSWIELKMGWLGLIHGLIFLLGVASICSIPSHYRCSDADSLEWTWWTVALPILSVIQFLEVTMAILSLWSILKLGKLSDVRGVPSTDSEGSESSLHDRDHYGPIQSLWENRCHIFCRCSSFVTCYLFGGKNLAEDSGYYGAIATVLADYFEDGGVLDVVPSDIVVGLIMLQRKQMERELQDRKLIREKLKQEGIDYHLEETGEDRNYGFLGSCFGEERSKKDIIQDDNIHQTDSNSSINTYAFHLRNRNSSLDFKLKNSKRKILSPDSEVDRDVMAEGARFARHALSIYTWVLYVYMKPCSGFCHLANNTPCCFSTCCKKKKKKEEKSTIDRYNSSTSFVALDATETFSLNPHTDIGCPSVVGDNPCQTHKNALLQIANLDNSDIAHANFKNSFEETPYAILVDHKWKAVVLTVRGTLSIEDCIVDVLVEPESLSDLGREYGFDGDGEYCHKGVLTCVRSIKLDLERHNVLHKVLAEYPSYKLYLTGHSLGAGVAAILSLMFRSRYPNLRCICISPPGGFITWKSAMALKEWTTSFVLDSDLVPRLSVQAMQFLRNEVLNALSKTKTHKMKIASRLFAEGVFSLCTSVEDDRVSDNLARRNARDLYDTPPPSLFMRQLEQFQRIQGERIFHRSESSLSYTLPLYPPGNIIHLVKTGQKNSYCKSCFRKCLSCGMTNYGSVYTPIYTQQDDFDEIVVSHTMWTDHFPDRICLELEEILRTRFIFGGEEASDCNCQVALKMGDGIMYGKDDDAAL